MANTQFHSDLKTKMDEYVHLVYANTKTFPKEELYGVTSQLRRAALSVILNYIEGYARQRDKVHKNFLEISFGSLKESMYLVDFCKTEGYLTESRYGQLNAIGHDIAAMLWGMLRNLDKKFQASSFKF